MRRHVILIAASIEFHVSARETQAANAVEPDKATAVRHFPCCRAMGYGKLLKMDFHDSTCDSNFRTDEQIDCPIRCNRYLDRTLQV